MKYEIHSKVWYQKQTAEKNRNRILGALFEEPMRFTELKDKLGLSRPVLSNHLKYLEKKKQITITRGIMEGQVVYRLTKEALELPLINTLVFKERIYVRIMEELIAKGDKFQDTFVPKSKLTYKDEEWVRYVSYNEPKPEFIAKKSEVEVVKAIDKWFTPIALYAIIQELKTGYGWTGIVRDLTNKIIEIAKLKGFGKFEDAFRSYYSKRLAPTISRTRYTDELVIEGEEPITKSLDEVMKHVKIHEYMDRHWRKEEG